MMEVEKEDIDAMTTALVVIGGLLVPTAITVLAGSAAGGLLALGVEFLVGGLFWKGLRGINRARSEAIAGRG